MRKKVNFNVIEKNKYEDTKDIEKFIQLIVNKLIANEYTNRI